MLVLGTDMSLPEKIVDGDSNFNSPNPLRMMQNINRCKDASWKGWSEEYRQSLIKKYKYFNGTKSMFKVGDVVHIKENKKIVGNGKLES